MNYPPQSVAVISDWWFEVLSLLLSFIWIILFLVQFLSYRHLPCLFPFPSTWRENPIYPICSECPTLSKVEKQPCVFFTNLAMSLKPSWFLVDLHLIMVAFLTILYSNFTLSPNTLITYCYQAYWWQYLVFPLCLRNQLVWSKVIGRNWRLFEHKSPSYWLASFCETCKNVIFVFRNLLPFILFSGNYPAGSKSKEKYRFVCRSGCHKSPDVER